MGRLLTQLLARAVLSVYVESATLTRTSTGFDESHHYFILVAPEHSEYWIQFKRSYSNSEKLAQERGARIGGACPEFSTQKGLLDWLADTLGLSQGERRLLYICEKAQCGC